MKKCRLLGLILALVLTAAVLAACSVNTTMSYTFQVETGDNIKIKLNTGEGDSLTQEDGQFTVKNGEDTVLQGFFVTQEMYDQYLQVAKQEGSVLDEGEQEGNPCLVYQYEGEAGLETNFVLWIEGSNTGVVVASISQEETARATFERLTFSKE